MLQILNYNQDFKLLLRPEKAATRVIHNFL